MEKTIAIVCSGKIRNLEEIDLSGVTIFEEIKMSEAGKLAAKLESEGAGAIISTAGNAPEVRKQVSVPVIVAKLTYFDVLEALKEVESLGVMEKKVGLILHEANSFNMERLQPYLKNHMSFFPFQDEDHLRKIIQLLFEKDFEALVGGPTTLFYAKQLGMNAHQIAFGKETIAEALNKVKEVRSLIRKDREEKQRVKTVIDMFPDGIIATDHNGDVTMCNPRALNLLNLTEQEVLGKKVYQIADDPTWKEVYEHGIKQTDVLMEYKKISFIEAVQELAEQLGIPLVKDVTYLITFDAWADNPNSMDVFLSKNHSDYGNYYSTVKAITATKQKFSWTVKMAQASDPNCRFGFGMGKFTGNVYLDNVSIEKVLTNGTEALKNVANDGFSLFPNPTSGEIPLSGK